MRRFALNVRRVVDRFLSGDIHWFIHHARLASGARNPVPRPPALLRSRSRSTSRAAVVAKAVPLKLLVFSHNLNREGASISLLELICGLKHRQAVVPEVIAFSDGPLRHDYTSRGITVLVLPDLLDRISTRERLAQEVEKLSERIRVSAADVVFVNTLQNFPAVLAAEHAGVPSVWNPRESEPWDEYFRFLPDPVAEHAIAAIGLPGKVVFVAGATRAVWKDFEHGDNFTVIHNALNLERFAVDDPADAPAVRHALDWSDDEVVFLCVGTLCERKGQADAVQAVEGIDDLLKVSVRLVFVGDCAGRYALEQQRLASARQGGKMVRIDFVDSTTDIGRYYLAADVFLMCARVESYPRVVLEALAFGLPIISTPVFGVTEQIPDPESACFYDPGDVAMLRDYIVELANNPEVRRRLGLCSRSRHSDMASFDQMLDQYERVVLEC